MEEKKKNVELKILFFLFNVDVRTNLRVPRLIPWALKLTTMYASSDSEVCGIQTSNL